MPARAVAVLDSQNVCLVYIGEFEEAEVEALMALASRGLLAAGLLPALLAGEPVVGLRVDLVRRRGTRLLHFVEAELVPRTDR